LGVFVAVLVTIVQLTLDRVDFPLLIGFTFVSVMNVDRSSVLILFLRNLAIEVESALLQLTGGPFSVRRIFGRKSTGPGRLWTDGLPASRRTLCVSGCGDKKSNRDCQ